MSMPIDPQERVLPVTLASAAAEAYVQQESDGTTFTDFYFAHQLGEADSYTRFCDIEQAAIDAELVREGEAVADVVEYLRVEYNLKRLLRSADEDAQLAYACARILLKEWGVSDPDILPIMQRSKRLGRHLGVSRSAGILNLLVVGLNRNRMFGTPLLDAVADPQGTISELVLNPDAYETFVKPRLGMGPSCPMLGHTAVSPHTRKTVNFYDLYWEAAMAKSHADFEQSGRL